MGQGETKGASASHVASRDEDGLEPSYSQVLTSKPSVRPSVRPSIRPSAFGPPRNSTRPPAPASTLEESPELEFEASGPGLLAGLEDDIEALLSREESNSGSSGERASEEPTPTGARRRVRNPEQGNSIAASIASSQSPATFRADLEDLLPFVSPKSSVPPVLPALPEKAEARPQDPKRNRLSFVIFGAMLLASIVPLVRYAATGAPRAPVPKAITPTNFEQIEAKRAEVPGQVLLAGEPAREQAPSGARPEKPPADPMLEALARAEADLPADSVAAADQLMSQGLKALAAGDERFAEALLGRALKRDDDNPRAYFALARIRLSQGNLQGAEGWIVSALHKRPRRAEYHTFYATVLEGLGRTTEAATARARAEELRNVQTEP